MALANDLQIVNAAAITGKKESLKTEIMKIITVSAGWVKINELLIKLRENLPDQKDLITNALVEDALNELHTEKQILYRDDAFPTA